MNAISTSAVRTTVLLLFLAAVTFSSAAWAESSEILGVGDSVRITVFQNPDFTTETRISERGTITFPLIGEVVIAGLTPAQAEGRIARQLSERKILLNPQVSLNLLQVRSRQVSVLGQVSRPGRYLLENNSTNLTDILALAGGITQNGDDVVTVQGARNGRIETMEVKVPGLYRGGDQLQDIKLENGDKIFVQRAPVFYIYGEVQRSGAYRLEPEMTMMQALSVGGGLTPRGTQRGLKVTRRTSDGKLQTIEAHLGDPVHSDDVIYIEESLF